MASKAECWYLSSYVNKFVKVVCKSMENLSFLLYYCLTIKVSKLCCTPLLWPIYFSQTIVKSFRVFFFLLSAAILQPLPPTFETSFPWCTAVDSVEYQSVLSCLIYCSPKAFSSLHYFFLLTVPSLFCHYRRTNPGVSDCIYIRPVSCVVSIKQFQFSSTTFDSWCCHPTKALSTSFFNFSWLSLSRSSITSILQGALAAVLECFCWWRRQQWILTKHG